MVGGLAFQAGLPPPIKTILFKILFVLVLVKDFVISFSKQNTTKRREFDLEKDEVINIENKKNGFLAK